MNREIKFRVWDKHDKVMKSPRTIEQLCWIDISSAVTEDYIFEQFTGLTDKNGKEIYEGDIVKAEAHVGLDFNESISFKRGSFIFNGRELIISHWDDRITLIGNIHENPELLEVQS